MTWLWHVVCTNQSDSIDKVREVAHPPQCCPLVNYFPNLSRIYQFASLSLSEGRVTSRLYGVPRRYYRGGNANNCCQYFFISSPPPVQILATTVWWSESGQEVRPKGIRMLMHWYCPRLVALPGYSTLWGDLASTPCLQPQPPCPFASMRINFLALTEAAGHVNQVHASTFLLAIV